MAGEFIYKVAFFERPAGSPSEQKDFYFGSLAAIYGMFTPEQVGCKVENLWNNRVSEGEPYANKLCRITREAVVRKQQKAPSRKRKSTGQ